MIGTTKEQRSNGKVEYWKEKVPKLSCKSKGCWDLDYVLTMTANFENGEKCDGSKS